MRVRSAAPRRRCRRLSNAAVAIKADVGAPVSKSPTMANCKAPEKTMSDEAIVRPGPIREVAAAPKIVPNTPMASAIGTAESRVRACRVPLRADQKQFDAVNLLTFYLL